MISLGVGLAETILCRAQEISEVKREEWFFLGPSVLTGLGKDKLKLEQRRLET